MVSIATAKSSVYCAMIAFYIKPTEAGNKKLKSIDLRPPYPGAKDYFYIADLEDHEVLAEIVRETYKELPEPKPRNKK